MVLTNKVMVNLKINMKSQRWSWKVLLVRPCTSPIPTSVITVCWYKCWEWIVHFGVSWIFHLMFQRIQLLFDITIVPFELMFAWLEPFPAYPVFDGRYLLSFINLIGLSWGNVCFIHLKVFQFHVFVFGSPSWTLVVLINVPLFLIYHLPHANQCL